MNRQRFAAVVVGMHSIGPIDALVHTPPRYTVLVPPTIESTPVTSTRLQNRIATIEGLLDPVEMEAAETGSLDSRSKAATKRGVP